MYALLLAKLPSLKVRTKNGKKTGNLYWQGKVIKRDSEHYQELLDKAYNALARNQSFKKALLATGNATLTHNMGKNKISETVLTKQEFVSRLTKIRTELIQNKR